MGKGAELLSSGRCSVRHGSDRSSNEASAQNVRIFVRRNLVPAERVLIFDLNIYAKGPYAKHRGLHVQLILYLASTL